MAKILTIETQALFDEAVREATRLLRAGGAVAIPTETVYGLAANAWDAAAAAGIYEVKGRPARNPLIVHVTGWPMLHASAHWPEKVQRLARAFWPGALTLVLEKTAKIPANVTAGGTTVAVRWPAHPFAQALIQACGFPLAAPSANPSNAISPTTAGHVQAGLGEKIQLIVDGGPCSVGIESTVVDVTGAMPRILRPGMIGAEEIFRAWGEALADAPQSVPAEAPPLRSPGLLEKHYAPKGRVVLWAWRSDKELQHLIATQGWRPADVHVIAHRRIPEAGSLRGVSVIPEDPEAYARALYSEWHACDASGARFIVVEHPPVEPAWEGILDRLRRAAA